MIEHIQKYMHKRHEMHEAVAVPPFMLYFSQSNDEAGNTAVPNQPIKTVSVDTFGRMREQFAKRNLPPCVQYVDAYTPSLTRILHENEFVLQSQQEIMICTPDSYRPVPPMPGLSTSILSSDSDVEEIDQGLMVHQLGFSTQATQVINKDSNLFRQTLSDKRSFILRLDDALVTTGMFTAVYNGVTELGNISTVHNFQRRGFGAYLAGYMVQVAFSRDIDIVFLTVPKNEDASVYKRIGFKSQAMLLTYKANSK